MGLWFCVAGTFFRATSNHLTSFYFREPSTVWRNLEVEGRLETTVGREDQSTVEWRVWQRGLGRGHLQDLLPADYLMRLS